MKGSTIRNLIAVALVSASALYGQSNQVVQANIPFDFQVGKQALSAGTYNVHRLNDSSRLLVIANRQYVKVNALLNPLTVEESDSAPKLVFLRYGDQYILSQICNGNGCASLPKQRTEQDRAFASSPETVTVYAAAGLP